MCQLQLNKTGGQLLKKQKIPSKKSPEQLTVPERGRLPVVVVVCEAGEAGEAAFVSLPLAFPLLPLLPPPPVLLEKLQLAVHLLSSLPIPTEGAS